MPLARLTVTHLVNTMYRHLALASCLLLAACATAPAPSTAPVSTPQHAEAIEGRFHLAFELPKNNWKVGEAIEGLSMLALVKGTGADLGGSGGGLLGFDFAEVNGTRRMAYGSTADCRAFRLEPGKPRTSAITKSGGFNGDDPNAAFYRAFFTDPVVRLPVGDWTITAVASFSEGNDCRGASHTLWATIRIHVTP